MVVESADDFGIVAGGQANVGEVGLPSLVGAVGGEADPGGSRPFLWLRIDFAGCGQDSEDR